LSTSAIWRSTSLYAYVYCHVFYRTVRNYVLIYAIRHELDERRPGAGGTRGERDRKGSVRQS